MMSSFRSRRFLPEFRQIALPVMALAVLNATLGIADVMMVGSLSSDAVAGVGLAAKLHFITILVILGFATAGRVLVAQYYGARQSGKIKESLVLTLFTSVWMISPFALLFGFSPESWLRYISDDVGIVEVAGRYLEITAVIVIFSAINLSFEISLRAVGYVKLPLYLGGAAAVTNIVLNYMLIFGRFGAPELGVEGAAWGSFWARTLQLGVLMAVLYVSRNPLAPRLRDLKILRDKSRWQAYMSYALPVVGTFILFGVGSSLYYVIAGRMGEDALKVISIISPIESLMMAVFAGYGEAVAILVGRALGARKYQFAWLLRQFTARWGIALAALTGVLLWLSHPLILAPFRGLEGETRQLVLNSYLILCLLIWVRVQNMIIIVGVLRAGGDNRWCLNLEIITLWLVGLPFSAFVGLFLQWSFEWVYLMMFLEAIIKWLASEWRIRQKVWLNNLTHVLA
jgi:putative MATE family efflux protein